MTRARLIEKVIAEWLKQDGWRVDDHGEAEYETAARQTSVSISLPVLAATVDVELDRIARDARETAAR